MVVAYVFFCIQRTVLGDFLWAQGSHTSSPWSPFASGVFLTASADRTIKLWNENKREPALTFQSGSEQVSDSCWSPNKSTVFASTIVGRPVERLGSLSINPETSTFDKHYI